MKTRQKHNVSFNFNWELITKKGGKDNLRHFSRKMKKKFGRKSKQKQEKSVLVNFNFRINL